MLCYDMLRYDMLCYTMLCYAMPMPMPHAMLCYAHAKDYFITGRANVIFCAVGLR